MRTGLRFLRQNFQKPALEMRLQDTEIMLLSWQAPQEFFGAARICFHAFCFLLSLRPRGFMMTGDWPGEIDRAISHVGRLHRFSDQRCERVSRPAAKKRLLWRTVVVLPPHDAERISPSRRGASPSRPHNALRPERRLVCVGEDARTEVGPRR